MSAAVVTARQGKTTRVHIDKLLELIDELVQAEVASSWAGGGAPEDAPILEAELRIARLELDSYLKIRREYSDAA